MSKFPPFSCAYKRNKQEIKIQGNRKIDREMYCIGYLLQFLLSRRNQIRLFN